MKTGPFLAELNASKTALPAQVDASQGDYLTREPQLKSQIETRDAEPAGLLLAARLLKLISTGCSLIAQLSLGLAIGFLGAEAYSWARWGSSSGPSLIDGFRFVELKLPLASWIGVEQVLEWAFTQSVFTCIGLTLLAFFTFSHMLAAALGNLHSVLMWKRLLALTVKRKPYAKPIRQSTSNVNARDIEVAVLNIEKAYDVLDRRSHNITDGLTAPEPIHGEITKKDASG